MVEAAAMVAVAAMEAAAMEAAAMEAAASMEVAAAVFAAEVVAAIGAVAADSGAAAFTLDMVEHARDTPAVGPALTSLAQDTAARTAFIEPLAGGPEASVDRA